MLRGPKSNHVLVSSSQLPVRRLNRAAESPSGVLQSSREDTLNRKWYRRPDLGNGPHWAPWCMVPQQRA